MGVQYKKKREGGGPRHDKQDGCGGQISKGGLPPHIFNGKPLWFIWGLTCEGEEMGSSDLVVMVLLR